MESPLFYFVAIAGILALAFLVKHGLLGPL